MCLSVVTVSQMSTVSIIIPLHDSFYLLVTEVKPIGKLDQLKVRGVP